MRGCDRCGEVLNLDLDMEDVRFSGMLSEGLLCRECRMVPPAYDRAVSFATYADEVRTLIRMLKFDGVRGSASLLGERLVMAILRLETQAGQDLLVIAVPLHKARQRQRGYNQSVLLARQAVRRLKALRPDWRLTEAHSALVRKRHTESQFVLSRKGRRRNLRGAFAVVGDVTGREVLLVDDILTSGATARECARVLKAGGAAKVWVATVARAQKQGVRRQHEDPGDFVARWDSTTTEQAKQDG
jgi:ComF family protein